MESLINSLALSPLHGFYGFGIILTVLIYNMALSRPLFLRLNALAVCTYTPYLIAQEAYTAVFILFVVAFFSTVQSFAPKKATKRDFYIRIGLSALALIIGLPFVVEEYRDIIPVFAYIFGRLSEIWPRKDTIVFWHLFVQGSWLSYYISEGFFIYCIGASICLIAAIYANRNCLGKHKEEI